MSEPHDSFKSVSQQTEQALVDLEITRQRIQRYTKGTVDYLDLIAEILIDLLFLQHKDKGSAAYRKLDALRESLRTGGAEGGGAA